MTIVNKEVKRFHTINMKRQLLKIQKTKIVKLTYLTKIIGGTGDTTFTTAGNSDDTTVAPTADATSNNIGVCPSIRPNESCESSTNDTENDNDSVPTFSNP